MKTQTSWLFFTIVETNPETGEESILNYYADCEYMLLGNHSLYLNYILLLLLGFDDRFDKLNLASKYLELNPDVEIEVEWNE